MWRLFPKFWFSDARPVSRAQSAAVDALYVHWRSWLGAALSRVLKRPVSPDAAVEALWCLDAKHFPALDHALRIGYWDSDLGPAKRGLVPLTVVSAANAETEAYLFTAACDANGFIREQALVTFRQFPGRLAAAAALIRANDWVPQVRDAGTALLVETIRLRGGEALLDLLSLLIAANAWKRMSESSWANIVEPAMLAPKCQAARWDATRRGSVRERLFAYGLITKADSGRLDEACFQAIKDVDPPVARWAIASGLVTMSRQEALRLLDAGLIHPHPSVRAEALRQRSRLDPAGTQLSLESALFDPARAPRNAAAFLLRNEFGIDPLGIWRDALDSGGGVRANVALLAIAEAGTAEDALRLKPWIKHPKARFRAMALRASIRVMAPEIERLVREALADPASCVVREALVLRKREPAMLDASVLDTAYGFAANDRTRALLIQATRHFGKWEALELLLKWSFDGDLAAATEVKDEIMCWLRYEQRKFTPLGSVGKARILEAVEACRRQRVDLPFARLEYVLNHAWRL